VFTCGPTKGSLKGRGKINEVDKPTDPGLPAHLSWERSIKTGICSVVVGSAVLLGLGVILKIQSSYFSDKETL
jgi:hypothetical protein